MTHIEKTDLPGLGVRYDFLTEDGQRVGVIHHRTGRRDLFICPPEDPDLVQLTVHLTEQEAHNLVDVLGGSQVIADLSHLQQHIEGLAIDWLPIQPGSVAAGSTIGDTRMRTRTGVSIVALLRNGTAIPAPEPAQRIEGGDTLVVVGTPRGIELAVEILRIG
ncbi:MAG TPA: cation:proton antiporter regulatory subunit [Acidimicrobiia bacterium]|nr:cation:proton antiporter regulatory subunit [Acidimicrobiia bacterium]